MPWIKATPRMGGTFEFSMDDISRGKVYKTAEECMDSFSRFHFFRTREEAENY